jgi:hypothetical protein
MDIVNEFKQVKNALRAIIESSGFRKALDEELVLLEKAGKRNEMGMLIQNLDRDMGTFIANSGQELAQAEKKVVIPFLEKHAPAEWESWKQAVAKRSPALGLEEERAAHVLKSHPISSLGHHFDKLTDRQALAMQPVVERASNGLREILSVPRPRAQAQEAIDGFVTMMKNDAVKSGIPGHVADGILRDVQGQVETRLAQAALKTRHIGIG